MENATVKTKSVFIANILLSLFAFFIISLHANISTKDLLWGVVALFAGFLTTNPKDLPQNINLPMALRISIWSIGIVILAIATRITNFGHIGAVLILAAFFTGSRLKDIKSRFI